jgi:hypothetical protein
MKDLPLECLLLAMNPKTTKYPLIEKYGLEIHENDHGLLYIHRGEFAAIMQKKGLYYKWLALGPRMDSCPPEGLFPCDVERDLYELEHGELPANRMF